MRKEMKKKIVVLLLCVLLTGCGQSAPPVSDGSGQDMTLTQETEGEGRETDGSFQAGSGSGETGEDSKPGSGSKETDEGSDLGNGSDEIGESSKPGSGEQSADFGGQTTDPEKEQQGQIQGDGQSGEDAEIQKLIEEAKNCEGTEAYEKLYALRRAPENPVNPEGKWNRTNVRNAFWGSFEVSEVTGESFCVEGEFGYYSHSGYFYETAYYVTDHFAIARYGEEDDDSEPAQYVAFCFDGDAAEVFATADSNRLGFGANVSVRGEYTQGEPVYSNAGILEELFTERNLEDLKALIPEEYYTDYFLFSTQRGCPVKSEETLPDGREGWCVECYVPTMGGYGYLLYFTEDGYYSILFENGYVFEATFSDESGS